MGKRRSANFYGGQAMKKLLLGMLAATMLISAPHPASAAEYEL